MECSQKFIFRESENSGLPKNPNIEPKTVLVPKL